MEDIEYPYNYTCPITLDLMLEPVIASDKKIYEKNAIIDWYSKDGLSPLTREVLSSEFILQEELQSEIRNFIDNFNIKVKPYNLKKKKIINFYCLNCKNIVHFTNFNKVTSYNSCNNCYKKYMLKTCNSCNSKHVLPRTNIGKYLCLKCGIINLIVK
jgi:hypothetical protein